MASEQPASSRGRTSRPSTPRSIRSQQQRSKSPPLDMFEHKKQRLEPYPVPEMSTHSKPSFELSPMDPAHVSSLKRSKPSVEAPPITYPQRSASTASKSTYTPPWDEEEALKWPDNQPNIRSEQNKRRLKYALIAGVIITVITIAVVTPLVYVNNNGPRHNNGPEIPGA